VLTPTTDRVLVIDPLTFRIAAVEYQPVSGRRAEPAVDGRIVGVRESFTDLLPEKKEHERKQRNHHRSATTYPGVIRRPITFACKAAIERRESTSATAIARKRRMAA
jgi:hypothetical protein